MEKKLRINIADIDKNRNWSIFIVKDESHEQGFVNTYFGRLYTSNLKIVGQLIPKTHLASTSKRFRWKYFHRRVEIWNNILSQLDVKRSFNEEEVLEILNVCDVVTIQKGIRHRLTSKKCNTFIADVWKNTDENNVSDECNIVRGQEDFGR